MKTIRTMLTSKWMPLLAVLVIAAWCPTLKAAYWNKNNSQSHSQGRDLDGDGIPNIVDPDIDNDGIPNIFDKNVDGGIARNGPYAGTYIGDHIDNDNPAEDDIDDDGLADDSLGEKDIDGDGKLDSDDDDIDGDGRLNGNPSDIDIDGDGLRNDDHAEADEDGDGIDNIEDDDDNNNGVRDIDDSDFHADEGENEVEGDLSAQPAAPANSTVKITLQRFGTGSAKFTVEARNLAVGSYALMVAGAGHGTLAVVQKSGNTEGKLVFKSADSGSGDLLLDFTVAGQTVEVRQGATVYFSGTAPAFPAISSGESGDNSVSLTRSPWVSGEAKAEASLHFGASGPTGLEVQMEKVPAGSYTVMIGEAARGTLAVTSTADGTEGELDFSVNPSGGTLALDFPAAGQSISLVQGTETFFFGQLPSAAVPPAP